MLSAFEAASYDHAVAKGQLRRGLLEVGGLLSDAGRPTCTSTS